MADEPKLIKAALHFQSDGEQAGVTDLDCKPMLKKIWILLDHFRKLCTQKYHQGADLAYNEISILMTGLSLLKKQLCFKPIGKGIQFLALAESNNRSQ